MDCSIDTKEILVSSAKKTGGTIEDFYIDIDNSLFPSKIKSVKLLDCFIPYTWYTITDINNSFSFNEPTGNDVTYINVLITNQYYDAFTMAIEIQNKLNSLSPNAYIYTVVFKPALQKFTFTSTQAFNLDFTVTNSIYKQLGFLSQIYNSNSNIINSVNLVDLVEDKYLFVHTNLIGGIDSGSLLVENPIIERNILASIPINSAFATIIYYKQYKESDFIDAANSEYNNSNSNTATINRLRFWLSLSSEYPLNMNGHNWVIKLLIKF
jgi:hypothetical protein